MTAAPGNCVTVHTGRAGRRPAPSGRSRPARAGSAGPARTTRKPRKTTRVQRPSQPGCRPHLPLPPVNTHLGRPPGSAGAGRHAARVESPHSTGVARQKVPETTGRAHAIRIAGQAFAPSAPGSPDTQAGAWQTQGPHGLLFFALNDDQGQPCGLPRPARDGPTQGESVCRWAGPRRQWPARAAAR